jgi:hypothetical protein
VGHNDSGPPDNTLRVVSYGGQSTWHTELRQLGQPSLPYQPYW